MRECTRAYRRQVSNEIAIREQSPLPVVPETAMTVVPAKRLRLREIPSPESVAGDQLKAAALTREVMHGEAWMNLVDPLLLEIDKDRDREGRRGPKTLFTSRELESVFLFGWLAGVPAAKDARNALGESEEALKLLGFDHPRGGKRAGARISAGHPSEPSLSRHRKRFGDERRLIVYRELMRRHSAS